MIPVEQKIYDGIFFRQRAKSPVLCSFVATSADIYDWAAVPEKTASDLRQFQRAEIPGHVAEITDFFKEYEENCSPSSITVGFSDCILRFNDSDKFLCIFRYHVLAGEAAFR